MSVLGAATTFIASTEPETSVQPLVGRITVAVHGERSNETPHEPSNEESNESSNEAEDSWEHSRYDTPYAHVNRTEEDRWSGTD